MIKRLIRHPLGVAALSFLGLLAVGGVLMVIFGKPSDQQVQDLTDALMPFRIVMYALIVGLWAPISALVARPRRKVDLTEDQVYERYQQLKSRLTGMRWYVGAFFIIYEVIFIQRLFP